MERYYGRVQDFFEKFTAQVFEEARNNDSYMITKPVTLRR